MFQTERNVQFKYSLKFLAYINMFQHHYLGNKKPTFVACNIEQVYTAILESSKINDLLQNREIYSRRIFETFRNFFDMVSVRLKIKVKVKCKCRVKTKTKMEGTCQQPKEIWKIVSSNSKDHIKISDM